MWDGVCLVGTQLIDAHGSHWHAAGARPILVSKQLFSVFDFVVVFYCLERLKSGAGEDFVLDMRTWQTDEFSENFQSPCFKVFVSICCLASVMFFSVVTVVVAFVLFGSAEEWYDGSHWHAGGAGGVTDRMLLELCVCVAQGGRLPTPSDPFP